MEVELQYQWMKRSKKYKTKYFTALGELFGKAEAENDSQVGQKRNLKGVEDEISSKMHTR